MGVLQGLQPRRVFEIFEEICAIPHGSGNTKAISDYCVAFGKKRGLTWYQDESNNVILTKAATTGMEAADPVILQGHLDMVCEKENGSSVDFLKDGIALAVDGGWVRGVGTSLGADDGIAVAMILAILERTDLCHPKLEAVFTTDEETGMDGARALDLTRLTGKRLINLDSEEEGIFTVSCAGGARVDCMVPVWWQEAPQTGLQIVVKGLSGGHSGVMIDKGLGNANVLMGRILYALCQCVSAQLASVAGGEQDNAIARQCRLQLQIPQPQLERAEAIVLDMGRRFARELFIGDPGVVVQCQRVDAAAEAVRTEDTKKLAGLLMALPNGVQAMSQEIGGLVQTSLNLGILRLGPQGLRAGFSVRSSLASEKDYLIARLQAITENFGGRTAVSGDYPAWEYERDSDLLQTAIQAYQKLYGTAPGIEAVHAGLECGVFAGGIQGLQCISFGPNLKDVHTVREAMEIGSVERTYALVLELLGQLGQHQA